MWRPRDRVRDALTHPLEHITWDVLFWKVNGQTKYPFLKQSFLVYHQFFGKPLIFETWMMTWRELEECAAFSDDKDGGNEVEPPFVSILLASCHLLLTSELLLAIICLLGACCFLLKKYFLLFATYYSPLATTYYLILTTYYRLLNQTYYLQPASCNLLHTTSYLLLPAPCSCYLLHASDGQLLNMLTIR